MSTPQLCGNNEPMSILYEASYTGNVSILNSLIQQNPLILFRISQTSFAETPLHISALLGHVDFTKALLSHNPKLALELDSSRSTPLHVASAEGHVDIVKELLKFHEEACLFVDEEGRIPLHYAAMRGRTEVARELVKAKADQSLSFRDNNGKSVFHLSVIYNHLETLKALVEVEICVTGKLLNLTSPDVEGANTVLHLAIMFKQVQIVRYLVTISEIREAACMKNEMGFTVHDMVKRSPKEDYKILEIQVMLMNAGIIGIEEASNGIGIIDPPHLPALVVESTTCNNNNNNNVAEVDQKENCCSIKELKSIGCWCLGILKSIIKWLEHDDEKWIKEMRGNLSLVSTVIATITFQALINPPGSFLQQNLDQSPSPSSLSPSPLSSSTTTALKCAMVYGEEFCPGQPVLFAQDSHKFLSYIICNTISFVSSLSVTLLLVSGFPLKNKAIIWVLSLGMCVTVSALALSYISALTMLIPDNIWYPLVGGIYFWTIVTWFCLLGLIGVLITIRFFIWLFKICKSTNKFIKSWLKRERWENGRCC